MIDRLEGRLVRKGPNVLIVEAGPVWLEVQSPLSTLESVVDVGDPVRVWTHLLWREDGPSLFGFATLEERIAFKLLLQVPSVGPRIALSVLAHLKPPELARQVRDGAVEALTRVPGVGSKTAQRILVELAPKVLQLEATATAGGGPVSGVPPGGEDAVQALTALGYPAREARRAVEEVLAETPGSPLEESLRKALRLLARSSSRSRG